MKHIAIPTVMLFLFLGTARAADQGPLLLRVPDQGVQPQAIVDEQGVLHLVYLQGKEGASDVYYTRRAAGEKQFSTPLRVNSQPGSAIAVGTIRGAHFATGKGGRVHVAWNGSSKAVPTGANNSSPMLYARLDDAGKAFEPQRNLMTRTSVLDGGGTVAADASGNVFVAWHGLLTGTPAGEMNRKVWVAKSTDDGKTFAQETPATEQATGVCGCCGMRAFADRAGAVYMLFRSATQSVHRDMYLLSSRDHGKGFECQLLHPWQVPGCPMSSEAFAEAQGRVVAAWETNGQIYVAELPAGAAQFSKPRAVSPAAGCKHPTVAIAADGRMLVAWTEGTGWKKGGALAWQVFDATGKPTDQRGRIGDGIPVWGVPAAVAQPDGRFLIIH